MPIPDQFTRIGDAMRRMNEIDVHFEVSSEDYQEGYRWRVSGWDCQPGDRAFDRENPTDVVYVEDDDFRSDKS